MSPPREVSYSGELRRIEALPRRKWEDYDIQSLWREINTFCSKPVRETQIQLWPIQIAALADLIMYRGGFFPIGVGQGKAFISILAAVVLEAKNPILFVPAQLREQTKNYVIPLLKKNFLIHNKLTVVGYSELSLMKNADLLRTINPDLIILDEAYYLKNMSSGRTRRLNKWFRAHPQTMCVAMSGTFSQRSLRDWAHIAHWCLKGRAPIPNSFWELNEWADALDEGVMEQNRCLPGALTRFCAEGESPRQGYCRRLNETPGVVSSKADSVAASLQIMKYPIQTFDVVKPLLRQLRDLWVTPDDDILADSMSVWRCIRELSLGFYYKWDPRPPQDWLIARRAWNQFVRDVLTHNRRDLDTELQVWTECSRKKEIREHKNHPWYVWEQIKKTFKPNSVAVWVSDFALKAATTWLRNCTIDEPGICWVESIAFGEKLSAISGFKYFGSGDTDILTCQDTAIVASMKAHSDGKNLQRYCRNLITSPMSSGKAWEQLIGRTHRHGQKADVVTFELFTNEPELLSAFEKAQAETHYLEDTYGIRQKLNYADMSDGLRIEV